MRGVEDALRSLARYTSEILGDDWEVRYWAGRGVYSAPFCRVQITGDALTAGSTMRSIEQVVPAQIEAYSVPAEDEEQALMTAHAIGDTLLRGFRGVGPVPGHQSLVPLYDYDGAPLGMPAIGRYATDYLRVTDFAVRTLPDGEDPRRVAVIASIRLRWDKLIPRSDERDRDNNFYRSGPPLTEIDLNFVETNYVAPKVASAGVVSLFIDGGDAAAYVST